MTTENERKALEAKAKSLRETAAALEMDGDDSWREYAEDASLFELAARALTAPAGVEVEAGVEDLAEWMFNNQKDKLAAPWASQWGPTKAYWRGRAAERIALAKPGEDFEAKVERVAKALSSFVGGGNTAWNDKNESWREIHRDLCRRMARAALDAAGVPRG